jgi:hypothetical protein
MIYSQQSAHHPDWAWQTPAGFRDEPFVLNFVFRDLLADGITLHRSLPVQCEDDADFLVRSVLFPQLGLAPRGSSIAGPGVSSPGRVRITTGNGQQLSRGLVLYSGIWCGAGMPNLLAVGGSLVDPLPVPAGGALSVDLQLATTGQPANASTTVNDTSLLVYANVFGVGGNGRTITIVDPGAPNSPLSVVLAGVNATISLQTNALGAISTTFLALAQFVNSNALLAPLYVAEVLGVPVEEIVAPGVLNLVGGSAGSLVDITGAFIGVKRYKAC